MIEMAIAPVAATDGAASSASAVDAVSSDEFLQIMVAELSCQDPLEPMSGAEFLTQLAQLRTAAASIQTGESVDALGQVQQIGQALSLLGQQVWWTDAASGETRHGEVTRVQPTIPPVLFVGSVQLGLSDIAAVGQAAPNAAGSK
jgi:flagellar basal-body rod modification protein FlgD